MYPSMKLEFPAEFDYVHKDIDRYGLWEPRTTEYIKSHLKKGQIFVDVGAQVGYYTVIASQLGAKVYAFEPSTTNRELLLKNIQDNKCRNVKVFSEALSNKSGYSTLFVGRTPGENSLQGTGGGEEVMLEGYDNMDLPTPDFIKIDVEGHEQQVLEGMDSVLKTDKPITIILEDWFNRVTDWLIDNYGFELVTTERAYGNRILVKNQKCTPVEEPLRIHLLGTFNTPTTLADEGVGNAFASKVVRMAKILKKLGHYVIFYGVEGSDVECDDFVQVSTKEILEQAYGKWEKDKVYGCNIGDIAYRTFNENCIKEINKRKLFGDFLLCCHGSYQKPIADAVNIPETLEIGIGYTGSFARFRIFESLFQMNWSYGAEGVGDINFYNTVIPGCFDSNDFDYREKKDDYFLYLGRIVQRKGVLIAQQVCEKLGKKLIIAGFGMTEEENKVDGKFFKDIIKMPNVEFVGFAGLEKRKELMSHAKAVFMPTTYLEPFGYVALEANFSGTPVITTDGGAFSETIQDGVNGYKCNTFKEFIDAVKNIDKIKPKNCRKWAMDNYSIEVTVPKYKKYFDQILGLYGRGWYKL